MERKIYRFVSLLEVPKGQQEFYAINFMRFFNENVYFFYYVTPSSKNSELIGLELINTVNNKKRYFRKYLWEIHNGSDFLEVRKEFVREATSEEMAKDGILQDIVAMRLKGEIN
jgi:hypothetical protein